MVVERKRRLRTTLSRRLATDWGEAEKLAETVGARECGMGDGKGYLKLDGSDLLGSQNGEVIEDVGSVIRREGFV